MIKRKIHDRVQYLASIFPIVTVTGPRQSGKTTLCRMVFPDKTYVSLEAPDTREAAQTDPRGFLAQYPAGAIIDEIQRVPDLLSYLQVKVDENPYPGRFILTGSANFSLLHSLSQSLAGRTAMVTLFPLSLDELRLFKGAPATLFNTLWSGGFPAVYDRGLPPEEWYGGYTTTYLERDVRQILNVTNLSAFQSFLRLCAGRTAQVLNLSHLGADCGITHNTARAWLTVLEAGYVAFRLPPFHANISKRLVKSPKLHFHDAGLLCYLLGIRTPEQLEQHPLRGMVFETWVVSEIVKARAHHGLPATDLSYYREKSGSEVDLVVKRDGDLLTVEIKSGRTVASDFFTALGSFDRTVSSGPKLPPPIKFVVYGGETALQRGGVFVVPWSSVTEHNWANSG